jgi:hypothetical protein
VLRAAQKPAKANRAAKCLGPVPDFTLCEGNVLSRAIEPAASRADAVSLARAILSKTKRLSKIGPMDIVAASHVKQNFGEVLARAALGPVGVERHRRLVAAIVPPGWLARGEGFDERRAARAAQQQLELQRLLAHQQLGIQLLCAPQARQRKRIEAALGEVDRWEAGQLCSADYIQRWRSWLRLPVKQLVTRMCSDAAGWGSAMRQNSPFALPRP